MLKALLVYESKMETDGKTHNIVQSSNPGIAAAVVVVMGILLSATGCCLVWCVEYMPDVPSRVLYCCLALCCLLIAASSTHGLGGHLAYGKGQHRPPRAWQFFQPFTGGALFIGTQAVAWTLFATTIVAFIMLLKNVVAGMVWCWQCWALGVSGMMCITQLVLAASLITFKGPAVICGIARQAPPGATKPSIWLPVVMMYAPVHICFTLVGLALAFLPAAWSSALLLACVLGYYLPTNMGDPAHTGCRTWPAVLSWFAEHVEASLKAWFGRVEVVCDFDGELDPHHKYVFGFHPHGLYPTGAGFLPLLHSFRTRLPGIRPVTLTASVLLYVPGIREIAGWGGFRQVSRHTFKAALEERGSVVLCPGGQTEILHTSRAFQADPELVVYCRHKGFVRVAAEAGAALVPVLALGEILQLRNVLDAPALQQYTYKRLGFPFPYLQVGRWWTPFPFRVPLVYVIGRPVHPPPGLDPALPPSQEVVDAMHREFYDSLAQMFDKYKHMHPQLSNARLVRLE